MPIRVGNGPGAKRQSRLEAIRGQTGTFPSTQMSLEGGGREEICLFFQQTKDTALKRGNIGDGEGEDIEGW